MLPATRTTRSKSRMRRSHQRLKPVNYSICIKCGQAKLPHAACTKCGYLNSTITLKVGKEESS